MTRADRPHREHTHESTRIAEVLRTAEHWYAQQLREPVGDIARAYLDARGVGTELRRKFRLGYASHARFPLAPALAEFDAPTIFASGLTIELEGRAPYARFRDRIMIPVRDLNGLTIGFVGRGVGAGEPKYIMSPDTPLFNKAEALFNLDVAADAARAKGRLILVEGVFDVIALCSVGIDEVVAPFGAAISSSQLETMLAIAETIVIALDADAAGRKASVKLALCALPLLRRNTSISFVTLPERQDPDDVIHAGGAAAFERHVSEAVIIAEYLATYVCDDHERFGIVNENGALESFAGLCAGIPVRQVRRSFFLAGHGEIARRFANR